MIAIILGMLFAYVWLKGDHQQTIDINKIKQATKKERNDIIPNPVKFNSTYNGLFRSDTKKITPPIYRSQDLVGEVNPFIDVARMHGFRPINLK